MDSADAVERIERCLHSRHRLWKHKNALKLLLGVPLTFIGPTLLATIFWFAGSVLLRHTYHVQWWQYFAVLTIIVIPLLFRLELRTKGDYLGEVARDPGPEMPAGAVIAPSPYQIAFLSAHALANPRGVSAGLVELFLAGPRLIVSAARQFRFIRRLRGVDVHRAADVVAMLASRSSGLKLEELQYDGENLDDLLPTLSWLAFHQWIGIGDKVDRVYLYSEARARLPK